MASDHQALTLSAGLMIEVARFGWSPVTVLAGLAIGIGLGAAAAGALTAFLVSGAVAAGLGEGVAAMAVVRHTRMGTRAATHVRIMTIICWLNHTSTSTRPWGSN